MIRARIALLAGAVICATSVGAAKPVCPVPAGDWRPVATAADVTRLHNWREAFVQGLAEARDGGYTAEVAQAGRLLDPDAAIDEAALPVGNYRCRTIKLGSQGDGRRAFAAYPAFDCRVTVDGPVSRFVRLDGAQRPTGILYRASTRQQVFLGSLVLGDESRALNYGRDADRNMVGAVERIDRQRWRMVLPYPRFESTLDVIELVPSS